jgi:hypothetical protein
MPTHPPVPLNALSSRGAYAVAFEVTADSPTNRPKPGVTDLHSSHEDVRVIIMEEDLVGSTTEIIVKVTVLPVMGIVLGPT